MSDDPVKSLESADEISSESDSDDQSSSTEEDEENTKTPIDSDASDGTSERCPICLLRLVNQEIATPESCDHVFCLECILEWSKNVTSCPMDRQVFQNIFVREGHGCGKIVKTIPVSNTVEELEELLDVLVDTFCQICSRSDHEDRMLLCDGCDHGFHMECLDPPLDVVPIENWFCPGCDPEHIMHQSPRGDLSPRLLPRTRETERVRTRVQLRRTERPFSPRPSTSAPRSTRRVTKKRRKTTRRRKTGGGSGAKDEKSTARKTSTGRVGKRRKKRRRIQKRIKVMLRSDHVKSVKARLSEQLGLVISRREDPSNFIVPPPHLNRGDASLSLQRTYAGIQSLRVFGSRDTIDYYSAGSDDEGGGDVGLITRRPRMSTSSIANILRQKRHVCPSSVKIEQNNNSSIDLLGSLLDSQSMFLARNPSRDTEIRRDGSLVHKGPKPVLNRVMSNPIVTERRDETPRLPQECNGPDVSRVLEVKKESNGKVDVNNSSAPVKESHGGRGGGGYNQGPPARGPSPNRNPAPQNFSSTSFGRDWNVGSRGPLSFNAGRGHERPQSLLTMRLPFDGDHVRPPGRGRGRGQEERPRRHSGSEREGEEREQGFLEGPSSSNRPSHGSSELFERRAPDPWSRRPDKDNEGNLWGRREESESGRPDMSQRGILNRPPRPDFLGGRLPRPELLRPRFDGPSDQMRPDFLGGRPMRPEGPRPRGPSNDMFRPRLFGPGSDGPRMLFDPSSENSRSEGPRHRFGGAGGPGFDSRPPRPSGINENNFRPPRPMLADLMDMPPLAPLDTRKGPMSNTIPQGGRDNEFEPPRSLLRPSGPDAPNRQNPDGFGPGPDTTNRHNPDGFRLPVPGLTNRQHSDGFRPSGPGSIRHSPDAFRPPGPGILNRQNPDGFRPIGPGLLNRQNPDGFSPRGPPPSSQRHPGPVVIPTSPQRPSGPRPSGNQNRPQGLMDLMLERPPIESPTSSSSSEFPRFLDPSKPPDVVNANPSFLSRPPFFERPPDLVQAQRNYENEEQPEQTYEGANYAYEQASQDSQNNYQQQSFTGANQPPNFQGQNYGQPAPFLGFQGGMNTMQSPYGLALPAIPVQYDSTSQPDIIPQMPQFFNSNQSAPPLFPSAATIQAAETSRTDYYDPTEALDADDVMDIPVPTQQNSMDIPLPSVEIPLPEREEQPDEEDPIPLPFDDVIAFEPMERKQSSDAERRSSLNAVASALSATTRRTGMIQINLKSQQAKQEELVNTISRLAKASLESIVAEFKSKETAEASPTSGHEEEEGQVETPADEEPQAAIVTEAYASESSTGFDDITIVAESQPPVEIIEEVFIARTGSQFEAEEENRRRKIKENLSLMAEMETKKVDSPIFEEEKEKKEKVKRKREKPAKEKSPDRSVADLPAKPPAEEPTVEPSRKNEPRADHSRVPTPSQEQPQQQQLGRLLEKERTTPVSDDSWIEKHDNKDKKATLRDRDRSVKGKERRSEKEKDGKSRRDKDKRSKRGRSRSPKRKEKHKKKSKDKRKDKHKKREKKAESDISLSEPEERNERNERVDASPVSSGEFPRPQSQGSVENISDSSLNLVSDAEDGEIPALPQVEKPIFTTKPAATDKSSSTKVVGDRNPASGDFEEGEISEDSPERRKKAEKFAHPPVTNNDLDIRFAEKVAPEGDVVDVEWRKFTKKTRSYREVTVAEPEKPEIVDKEKTEDPVPVGQSPSPAKRGHSRSQSRGRSRTRSREREVVKDTVVTRFIQRVESPEEMQGYPRNIERGLSVDPPVREESSERVVYRRSKSREKVQTRDISRTRRSVSKGKRKASPSRDRRQRSISKAKGVDKRRSLERKRRSLSRTVRKRTPERHRRTPSRNGRKQSRDRSGKRGKSGSKSPKRRRSRSPVKRDRSAKKSPERKRIRSKSPLVRRTSDPRPPRSVSKRAKSPPLSPARREELIPRSRSRSLKKRRTSRSGKRRRSRDKKRKHNHSSDSEESSSESQSSSAKDKKEKRKKKRDDKKKTKKKPKEGEAVPRKEVVASGDNIRISVNFSQNAQQAGAVRGRPAVRGKRRKLQLKPRVPPVMIDLIEGTETTLNSRPPQVVCIDSDGERIVEAVPNLEPEPLTDSPSASPVPPENPPIAEETPAAEEKPLSPPPVQAQQKIRIKIRDEPPKIDKSKDIFFDEEPLVAPSRGPVTPPEPSPKKDEYDPCDPTESPEGVDNHQDLYSPPTTPLEVPSPSPEPTEELPTHTDAKRESLPPSPKKSTPDFRAKSPESVKATAVVTPLPPSKPVQAVVHTQKQDMSQPPPGLQPQGILTQGLGSMVPRSFVPHQLLAAAVMAQAQQQVQAPMHRAPGLLLNHHQSVPPHMLFNIPALQRAETPNFFQPPPMMQQPPPTQQHESLASRMSPKSPDSSELSDLFEPPVETKRPRRGPRSPPPPSMSKKHSTVPKKKPSGPMQVDDVPSSAMELQALIKLTRQEQIVEQVKIVLKPHYRKKKINKEEYKDIMKRAVSKITHSRASSINPSKVEALVNGYVKKIVHERRKT